MSVGNRYHVHLYRSEDQATQSIRIGQTEDAFAIGVDLRGTAGDMPVEVVAEMARFMGKVLDRHLRLKAQGTSKIIVPQTGLLVQPGVSAIAKRGNGYALRK
jgi:3,4-dihydroxy-2-butanone 4-phosphate synthase